MAATALATTSTDVLLVAQLLGPSAVPTYSVAFALMILFFGVCMAVLEGFWPAYVEASSKGDVAWIRKTNQQVMAGLLAVAIVFAIGLVFAGETLIDAWAGPEAVPPRSLLLMFGLIAIVQAVDLPHNRIIVATGHVRRSTLLGLLAVAINVPLSILLGMAFGVAGVAAGTLVAYGVTVALVVTSARRALREVEAGSALGGRAHGGM
jgi:O-antigen/teichoic acid export membrane protein